MAFLEQDVQGSDYICRDLMDDLTAIEDESDDSREFIGNAHRVQISPDGVLIAPNLADNDVQPEPASASPESQSNPADRTEPGEDQAPGEYHVALKHFREVLEDWEAFILDDQLDDPLADDEYL